MTHRSVNVAAIGPQGDVEGGNRAPMRTPFPKKNYVIGDHNLGHGGGYTAYENPGSPEHKDTWIEPGVDEYFREAAVKKAEVYKDTIMAGNGHGGGHFAVWPSFVIDHWRIRPYYPHGVNATERHSMYAVDKNAPKEVKDAMRHYVMRYNGPSGITESDDMENWNYVFPASLGTIAQRLPYNFEAGLGHEFTNDRLPGVSFNKRPSEESQRARFSRWLAFMEAKSWDDLYPLNQKADHNIWKR